MWDPESVTELLRVQGKPITISLAASEDFAAQSTAGRLCWLERKQQIPFARTEIYCAQLQPDGVTARPVRLVKSFGPTEEPSCGIIQDDDTILWTALYR